MAGDVRTPIGGDPDAWPPLLPAPTIEQSLARIAAAFERIATALEDGKASTAGPQAQPAKKPDAAR